MFTAGHSLFQEEHMRRSVWIAGLKGSFVSFLGMSEFEAGKAAVIAADHARGPWDAERVFVPPVAAGPIGNGGYRVYGFGIDLSKPEAHRAADILNGYEAAREAFLSAPHTSCGVDVGPKATAVLRAFLQIEEE
jgi:hypothetical protein